MFSCCTSLTSIDVSHFNTQKVTNMSGMFSECTSLTSINVSRFDTQNVTEMVNMFYDCNKLTSIDVSLFNTSKVMDMAGMFGYCTSLTGLELSNFDTSKVEDMRYMFADCTGLTQLDVTNFDTGMVTTMYRMFSGCTGLTVLDLSNFNTSALTNTNNMFENSNNLKTIFVGEDWTVASVSYSNNMFSGCTSLKGHKGTVYDANHVDAEYARIDGGTTNPGYFTDISYKDSPYALLSADGTTLTFYHDGQRLTRTENTYDLNEGSNNPGWYSTSTTIRKVVFHESFDDVRPTSTYSWFAAMTYLNNSTNIEYRHT
jgi:surface protein